MRKLLAVSFLAVLLGGCYTYAEIPDDMLHNAACACKDNGGVDYIKVNARNSPGASLGESRFNFVCNSGLETGWWDYNGAKGHRSGVMPWYDANCKTQGDTD